MTQLKFKIGGWKIVTNKEINMLIKHADIDMCIKAQRIEGIEEHCKNA
jgi:hypothetical protein